MIVAHNSELGVSFYNDRVKEIISADLIAEPFTYVPIKAGHMELVGGNALVFGKITEGYDVIAPDITTVVSYEDISLRNAINSLNISFLQEVSTVIVYTATNFDIAKTYYVGDVVKNGYYFFRCKITSTGNVPVLIRRGDPPINDLYWYQLSSNENVSLRLIQGYAVITIPSPIAKEDSVYYVDVENATEGISKIASYKVLPGDTTVAQIVTGLSAALIAAGIEVVFTNVTTGKISIYRRSKLFMQTPSYEVGGIKEVFDNFVFSAYISELGYTINIPQLKCGAVHTYGLVYKDRSGRTCSVIKSVNMTVRLPFYSEIIPGQEGENNLQSIINLVFKLYHKPPSWAETYEIVYFGNISMDYFLQLRADNITSLGNNRYSLNIQDTINDTRNRNSRWKTPDFVWNPDGGDRIRLLGTIYNSTGYGAAIGGGFVYDYEIEQTGDQYGAVIGGDWLIFQAVDHPTPFAGETNIIVEVYRPRKGLGQTVAYGTGMVFGIATDVNGFRYHKGIVDQVFDESGACITPAEVDNTANDCWKYLRLNYKHGTGIIYPFWAESTFPSDWWGNQIVANKLTSQGFPFLDDLSQRQTILDERFRFGGSLISGTRTNNIAHFTYENFRDLQKKDGDITGLREVGFTLKAIQLYKETSIYINRVQSFNPDGTSQFMLTDSFIGDMRPMERSSGCQHPDGIIVNGRNVYYWDNSHGEFIRSSPNGQEVLDVKMKRWFKDLAKWVNTNGGREALQVRIGANNEFEEIWITFRMGDQIQGIIFSEKQGRFISRINQITETYIHLGNFFAHLYNQRLWIMNVDEGQDYLNWAGVPTFAEIEIVSNMSPEQNKVYNAVALFSDHELSSLPKYVYIPQEASAGESLMESNIPIWDRREGIFFGEILKDENSKGSFLSLNDKKMNGDAMRGRYCFVKLMTEEHTEKVRVDSIVVFSTPSERNI